MTREQLIETMARAMLAATRPLADPDKLTAPPRGESGWRPLWSLYANHAAAALTAIEAAGMRVVPVEPVEHDPTNPFAPRERPKKSIRLMTDAERRAAGLDPNGGFDGPTGAD